MNLEKRIERAEEAFRELIKVCPDLEPKQAIPSIAEDFMPMLPSEDTDLGFGESGEMILEDAYEAIVGALWGVWEKAKYEVE